MVMVFRVHFASGRTSWYKDAEHTILHRTDGPAVDYSEDAEWVISGSAANSPYRKREWWVEGKRHRENGPAVEWEIKSEKTGIFKSYQWYQHGKQHRVDGPAVEYVNQREEWYQKGVLHRLDGPAVTWYGNIEEWYKGGVLHRLDGPAVIYADGQKEWLQNGVKHRLDGPAYVSSEGNKSWFLFGVKCSEKQFNCFRDSINQNLNETDFSLIPYKILKTIFLSTRIEDK